MNIPIKTVRHFNVSFVNKCDGAVELSLGWKQASFLVLEGFYGEKGLGESWVLVWGENRGMQRGVKQVCLRTICLVGREGFWCSDLTL